MKEKNSSPPTSASEHYIPYNTIHGQAETYTLILQSSATNALAHTSARKKSITIDPITKVGTMESGDLKLYIKNCEGPLPISARKLLDAMAMELTKQTDYRGNSPPPLRVSMPLKQYMALCGQNANKKNMVDAARKRVEEDLDILFNVSIQWRGKNAFSESRICTYVAFKRGTIHFSFSPDLAEYLQRAHLMQYNIRLFQLGSSNPHIWFIARKLNEHYSIARNMMIGTANTISVASLLRAAPEIPSFEEVERSNRAYTKRIIMPLENSLDQLVDAGILREWTYRRERDRPFTDKQRAVMDYDTFAKLYVRFEFANALPELPPRPEAITGPVKEKSRRNRVAGGGGVFRA